MNPRPDALRPDWARAWAGTTVLVAASGPSQCKEDLDYARGKARVVVINSTWKLAPWADVLYFCDANWWFADGPRAWAGRMIVGKAQDGPLAGVMSAKVVPQDRMIWDGCRVGGGANSTFQVLNLLAVWGVARVVLTGLDCRLESKGLPDIHWHGPHATRPNPKPNTVGLWIDAFRKAAPELRARGLEVLNASRVTALDCFERVELREAL